MSSAAASRPAARAAPLAKVVVAAEGTGAGAGAGTGEGAGEGEGVSSMGSNTLLTTCSGTGWLEGGMVVGVGM